MAGGTLFTLLAILLPIWAKAQETAVPTRNVPLTLAGSASRMQGRGEALSPVTVAPFAAVLVTQPRLRQVHGSKACTKRKGAFHEPERRPPARQSLRLTGKTRRIGERCSAIAALRGFQTGSYKRLVPARTFRVDDSNFSRRLGGR